MNKFGSMLGMLAVVMTTSAMLADCHYDWNANQGTDEMKRDNVTMEFVDMQAGRPPLVILRMNVTLFNDTQECSWFILPSKLNLPTVPVKDGVDGVEVFSIQGQGRAVIAQFQGRGGFQALRLPVGAKVSLANLAVSYWGELPDEPLNMEVVVASRLMIDGEPAEAWTGGDSISDETAVVNLADAVRRGSRFTPDRREVAVTIADEHRISVRVELKRKNLF